MQEDTISFESSLVDLVLSKPVRRQDLQAVVDFCSLFGPVSHFVKADLPTVRCCNS